MCGIVGYAGPDEALPIIIEGLRRLEYRGYDSAGVAVLNGGLDVVKRAGKLASLETALAGEGNVTGSIGMGHTRWATHGAPTDRNAHPHQDCHGRIAVIHNGIIENFQTLRARLEKEGHAMVSETDTNMPICRGLEAQGSGGASRATVGSLRVPSRASASASVVSRRVVSAPSAARNASGGSRKLTASVR